MKTKLARPVLAFSAGILVAIAGAGIADFVSSQSARTEDCGLAAAAQAAVNNKIKTIAMTSPDPGKYFSASSPDSCLGNLSLASLDLSRLIPDPMGLMNLGVDGLIDGLKKAALAAGCVAVRSSVGDVIGKYNNAVNSVNAGMPDVKGAQSILIDSSLGTLSKNTMDSYAMDWKTTPQATDVTAGIPAAASGTSSASKWDMSALKMNPTTQSEQVSPPTPNPAPAASSGGLGASLYK